MKGGGPPAAAERPDRLIRVGRNAPVWAVLRILAPVIVAAGLLGVVVGLLAGQSIGIVALDAMVAVVGGILLLILRWR